MGFGQSISEGFKNYFNFRGTALRSEFWYFYLFFVLLNIVASVIDSALFGNQMVTSTRYGTQTTTSGPLSIIVSLGLLIPYLSVLVRRLHDTGRRWYYMLISLIPLVGPIILIVRLAEKGNKTV